jgi:hypothetical protein
MFKLYFKRIQEFEKTNVRLIDEYSLFLYFLDMNNLEKLKEGGLRQWVGLECKRKDEWDPNFWYKFNLY